MAKKILILVWIFILIPFSLAYDLSDFPELFIKNQTFDVVGVYGEDANDLIRLDELFWKLAEDYNIKAKSPCGDIKEDDVCTTLAVPPFELKEAKEVINLSQNIISIGGPCANKITAQIMNVPTTWPECAEEFQNGTSRIILYNNSNKIQLVIAGFSAEDTKRAANVVSDYKESNLSGYEIVIFGSINKLQLIKLTERYNDWHKRENNNVNFSHPYVKWLIDKKGNGTFWLYITTKPDILIEGKQKLAKFGKVGSFSCSESENRCHIFLKINNFDIIKDLFRIHYVEDINFREILSDYKLNISLDEMKKCSRDEECVIVSDECCGCGFESININYKGLWNTKIYCHNRVCIQRVCTIADPKCINGQCGFS